MTTTTSSKIGTESPNPPRLAPPAAPVGFRMVLKLGLLAGRGQRKLTSIEPPQTRPSKLTTSPQPPSLKGAPFKLGGWGLVVNLLGLARGGSMLVNFLWPRPARSE